MSETRYLINVERMCSGMKTRYILFMLLAMVAVFAGKAEKTKACDHELKQVNETPPTIDENGYLHDGNEDGYKCEKCGEIFLSDKDTKEEDALAYSVEPDYSMELGGEKLTLDCIVHEAILSEIKKDPNKQIKIEYGTATTNNKLIDINKKTIDESNPDASQVILTTTNNTKYYKQVSKDTEIEITVSVICGEVKNMKNVKINLILPEPKISEKNIVKKWNNWHTHCIYTFKHKKINGATAIKVRIKGKENDKSLNRILDKYITSVKGTKDTYIGISKKTMDKLKGKVTFKVWAVYGNKKSPVVEITK